MTMELQQKIEALLFSEGGTIAKKKLAQILEADPDQLAAAIQILRDTKQGTGLTIVETERDVTLAVAPEATETVQGAFERELGREIGDAGLEVLAIVLYRGPSTRSQIDYIRGVNTSSTIRLLAARGLLERTANPEDAREYLYRPTVELLAHLGARDGRELPEYAKIASELAAFEESQKSKEPFDDHAGNTEHSE
ncbi:MAG: SMC-Scp complex subunit ScpB [Candidatus Paceibacterota bacterium]